MPIGPGNLPPGSITFSDMTWNKTGSWRYLKPKFVKKWAPCSEACPAGNDVEAFMMLAGSGRYSEALDKILQESPFPGVCGRACYHPCELACNRSAFDESLAIQPIERYISEFDPHSPVTIAEPKTERIAIVGSGPAGLTCAYHLARLGYSVMIFEKEQSLGGMLRMGIPAYRLPRAVLDRDIERITGLGIGIKTGCLIGRDMSWDELLTWDAVFLGIGAHRSPKLEIPGEAADTVQPGTRFLNAVNSGATVSVGERVAVIGGGNTAIDCARSALRLGSRANIVYRRAIDEMPAIASEVEEAIQEGVSVMELTSPISIQRTEDGAILLECIRNREGEPDASNRRRPEPISGSEFRIEVDTVITAVGEQLDTEVLPTDLIITKGAVEIDGWGRTNIDKILSGGDATNDVRMAAHAIGAGKRAAIAIDAALQGRDLDNMAPSIFIGDRGSISMERYLNPGVTVPESSAEVVRPEQINTDYFSHNPRVEQRPLELLQRVGNFGEVHRGFSEDQAAQEASRCFHCGACDACGICSRFCPDFSIILGNEPGANRPDIDHCKGCGICAEECPRSAVIMERE
jgi:NADPH-dependent glutamate synthase beta subunit-like oxidoreductase